MGVRAAEVTDAAALAALSIEVWLSTYVKRGISAEFAQYVLDTFTPRAFLAELHDPDVQIFVSDNADGIDGYIKLQPNRTEWGDMEITTFYVQPRHQGSGVGRALLTRALVHCQTQGATQVWLSTNSENHPAIGFYEKQGFMAVGECYFELEDARYLNVVLARELIR